MYASQQYADQINPSQWLGIASLRLFLNTVSEY
jgi:hypothetical protein